MNNKEMSELTDVIYEAVAKVLLKYNLQMPVDTDKTRMKDELEDAIFDELLKSHKT